MPKILVIEDIDDNATLVQRVLSAQGYEVYWANTAEKGLEMAGTYLPDLILLDLGLPDIDGQTLVGYLRQTLGVEQTPIMVVSAWPIETARLMVSAYGCNDYMSKPIDVRKFIEKVNTYIHA